MIVRPVAPLPYVQCDLCEITHHPPHRMNDDNLTEDAVRNGTFSVVVVTAEKASGYSFDDKIICLQCADQLFTREKKKK